MSRSSSDVLRPLAFARSLWMTGPSCFGSPASSSCESAPSKAATGATASGSSACPASSTTTRSKWPRGSPWLCSLAAMLSVHTTTSLLEMSASSGIWNAPSAWFHRQNRNTSSLTSFLAREYAISRSICMGSLITALSFSHSTSAAVLVGAATSTRNGGRTGPRTHCSTASTMVVVLPVPGGPKMMYGTCRPWPPTTAATAMHCCGLPCTEGLNH
mmetsp:Transcript_35813/g.90773  ORF Transcript_35813/g.90773 Transcript_35813/m.90773 type:complete len:215 (-) Transcript_35813:218-862(-)